MADVASAQPQTNVRIDPENLKQKRYDIRLVICKATARYSHTRAGGEAEAHNPRGACVAHTKARFVRDDKRLSENFLAPFLRFE
jgi:hypothetical protein